MKILTSFTAFSLAVCIGLLGPVTVSEFGFEGAQAQAADGRSAEKKKKTRRVPTISESIFKKLGEAQELMDAKEYGLAEQFLKDMLNRAK